MHHLSHEPYYRDRLNEYELCNDFPADEIFIDGLHAMQCHFHNNRVAVDIPVVRVMNAAHFIAAYMFATTCSGDQTEYDVLAYSSTGHDKKLAIVTMIVLAAMLQRTEGFRARQCRNVILDNRDPDFEEGVTLYDHFLRSAEKRFAEEDFLIDVHSLVTKVHEQEDQIAELTSENVQLKYTLTTMEEKYQQVNIGTQNVNYGTINNYYGFSPSSSSAASDNHPKEDSSFASDNLSDSSPSVTSEFDSDIPDSIIFTKKAKKEGKEAFILQSLQKSVQGRKDKTRAFVQELQSWQKDGYVDAHYNSRVMYDELDKLIPLPFGKEVFKKYYNNTI